MRGAGWRAVAVDLGRDAWFGLGQLRLAGDLGRVRGVGSSGAPSNLPGRYRDRRVSQWRHGTARRRVSRFETRQRRQ
jgi:hypothetical protein